MWQSQNQKSRTAAAPKKSGRTQNRNSLRIKRVTAEIRAASLQGMSADGKSEAAGSARILLNDLSGKGVGVYCNKSFVAGQEVAVVLNVNGQIYIRGVIVYCHEQESKTQVISKTPYYYRIGIKFVFENTDEEARIAKYCEDLVNSITEQAA